MSIWVKMFTQEGNIILNTMSILQELKPCNLYKERLDPQRERIAIVHTSERGALGPSGIGGYNVLPYDENCKELARVIGGEVYVDGRRVL